ncbi:Universal stress protein G [Providencia rustigianii]|uniref:Universal stress protein n=2 Tax=Providencia rustigianii TaxID=158850 RepID=D1NY13_9GAMM|nr:MULTISPECIES: universal stress protein [Providencia]EFB73861.1 universal stress family protein [Providencia rustigianii DSM 4541]MTC57283.1 universal stress protein [Providencia rustigianii]MTC60855.1 universal stress protein [Providencia rustigianii]SPY77405.1 Universal stress protein G [Providencia rustigianii]SUC26790.1 Universal stress protein G [Providencia rustigianii]
MYKTILVPVDISEDTLTDNALKHAIHLAKMDNANIHLFHSVPDVSRFSMSYSYHYDLLASFTKKALERSEEQLKELIDSLAKKYDYPADKISYKVEFGSPRDKVLAEAENIHADLIVIGSRNPSFSTHLLGSNASGIVSYAKISVLVVR